MWKVSPHANGASELKARAAFWRQAVGKLKTRSEDPAPSTPEPRVSLEASERIFSAVRPLSVGLGPLKLQGANPPDEARAARAVEDFNGYTAWLRQAALDGVRFTGDTRKHVVDTFGDLAIAALVARGVNVEVTLNAQSPSVRISPEGTHPFNVQARGFLKLKTSPREPSLRFYPADAVDTPGRAGAFSGPMGTMRLATETIAQANALTSNYQHEVVHAHQAKAIADGEPLALAPSVRNATGVARPLLPGMYEDAFAFHETAAYAVQLKASLELFASKLRAGQPPQELSGDLRILAAKTYVAVALASRTLAVARAGKRELDRNPGAVRRQYDELGATNVLEVRASKPDGKQAILELPLTRDERTLSPSGFEASAQAKLRRSVASATAHLQTFRLTGQVLGTIETEKDPGEALKMLDALRPLLRAAASEPGTIPVPTRYSDWVDRYNRALDAAKL
jgi:hypothetical protein